MYTTPGGIPVKHIRVFFEKWGGFFSKKISKKAFFTKIIANKFDFH